MIFFVGFFLFIGKIGLLVFIVKVFRFMNNILFVRGILDGMFICCLFVFLLCLLFEYLVELWLILYL